MEFEPGVKVSRSKGTPGHWLGVKVAFDSLDDDINLWLRDQLSELKPGEVDNLVLLSDWPKDPGQESFTYIIEITDDNIRSRDIYISEESLVDFPIVAKFLRSLVFVDDRHIFDNTPTLSPEQRLQKKPKFRKPN